MNTKKETVVIAMSGGVDSSVCAKFMLDQGYECVGMTMRLWKGPEAEAASCSTKSCCGHESVEDARLVCETLGIPYYAINFRQEFWDRVVRVFAEEYFAGRTPSPCILCNEKMKFDTLYKKAVEIGATKVCTGHYARIVYNEKTERWNLLRGKDRNKDQSYFLFSMTQEQLSKTLFPCGSYEKGDIRALAGEAGLVTAKKPESMDICFVPDGDYAAFLERHFPDLVPKKGGKVVHEDGTELGEHDGIHTVTIGQRKGLGIAFGEPLYVTQIDPKKQQITVGEREKTLQRECSVKKINWISHLPKKGEVLSHLTVRIRSRGPEASATLHVKNPDEVLVKFADPQHAITPGQAAVFYAEEQVIGGGWIGYTEKD